MSDPDSRTRLSRANWAWLESQSSEWVHAALIDPDTRARILASYEVASAERRSLLALMLLGALMFGIGVLLLIGYNWASLPAAGKVTILMASVALAFGASAATFARRHPMAGETLAFLGVLLYGNAIWLIAQVLHIRGDFADAFMWWAIGALACAWLIRSQAIGASAAFLVLVWIFAAGQKPDRPDVSFLVVWTALVVVTYQRKSALMLVPSALALIVWVCWMPERVQPGPVSIGVAALAGCAFYAIGSWHRASHALGRPWQMVGLGALLGFLVPLLIREFHDDGNAFPVTWRSLVVIVPPLVAAASLLLRRTSGDSGAVRAPGAAAAVVVASAIGVAVWLALLAAGRGGGATWTYGVTMGFSVLALALSAAFIHKALRSDSASDLVFGVCFGLAFLLVRWASLIDSMLWSGVMLIVASGAFFAIARLWRGRERRPPGALSPAGMTGAAR